MDASVLSFTTIVQITVIEINQAPELVSNDCQSLTIFIGRLTTCSIVVRDGNVGDTITITNDVTPSWMNSYTNDIVSMEPTDVGTVGYHWWRFYFDDDNSVGHIDGPLRFTTIASVTIKEPNYQPKITFQSCDGLKLDRKEVFSCVLEAEDQNPSDTLTYSV